MILSILSILFLVIIGLFPVGQFERILLPLSSAVYVHELVMILFIGVVGIHSLQHKKNFFSYLRGRMFFPWSMVTAWILLSICLLSTSDPVRAMVGMMYLARLVLYLVFARAVQVLLRDKLLPKALFPWIPLFWGCVIALVGWAQYLFIPDTRGLALLGWDNHYLRLISTFFDPGFTGILLACCALLFQLRLGKIGKSVQSKLYVVGYLVVTSALLLTYSRASFVAYGVGCLFLALRKRKVRHLVLLGVFAMSMLLLPRPKSEGTRLERTASITARLQTFTTATNTPNVMRFLVGNGWYAAKPITSRVENGVSIPSHASAPENSYLFVYHALGIIGLALVTWAVVGTLKSVKGTSFFVVFFAISAHALFTNTFLYPFVLFFVGIVMAGSERESH